MLKLKSVNFKEHGKLILALHAFLYVGVNAILVALNIMTDPHYFWAKWPILIWGIGLAMHAVVIFKTRLSGLIRFRPTR